MNGMHETVNLRKLVTAQRIITRAAAIPKFPPIPIPIPILRYSPIPILPLPEIADTFADTDTDTFKNSVLKIYNQYCFSYMVAKEKP